MENQGNLTIGVKPNDVITIGDDIQIVFVGKGKKANGQKTGNRITIRAPRSVRVKRVKAEPSAEEVANG